MGQLDRYDEDEGCIRANSMQIIDTCHMLARVLYVSEPVWLKYEGLTEPLDLHRHR